MGPLGWQETVFIFLLALLIFGPKKLPELGRTIGKAMTEFRRASSELKSTFDREMQSLERETEPIKEVANSINYDSYNYESSYDSGAYNYDSNDNTASNPSTASASATEGAQSTTTAIAAPEGVVAQGEVVAAGADPEAPAPPPAAETKAVSS
ncbi:MAG: twin-arginine translocase TatA/TatE family subunit [Candidatus Solibacter usitatus]|nr:twin-arginine translocase TatA/TatE family subunit [Candidatus Solibacter usitatus]